MAKSSTKAANPAAVTITYDLMSLPTAQHKAGLAGLLLELDSLKNRGKSAPLYRWDEQCPRTTVHVDFTRETAASLFDDVYDAELIEGPPREKPFTKGKGAQKQVVPPLRRAAFTKTDKRGNQTSVEGYVYLELTPSLATLRHYLPSADWVKLWRDLIWQVIRDSRKKAPFIKRATAKQVLTDGVMVGDGEDDADEGESESGKGDGSTWDDILKYAAAKAKGTHAVGKLSGALLLGAMEKNAEALPLVGQIEQNLLLHFWPLSILIFIPRFVDRDGDSHLGRRNKKDRSPHFAVALPEVADLRTFIRDYPRLLQGLGSKLAGIRPAESIIDLPGECGLVFIEHLAHLVPSHLAESEVRSAISAVDYFHLTKEGNNVKFLASGRIQPRPRLAEDYVEIAGRSDDKAPYANPLFRRGLLTALLDELPWFKPFARMFAEWPHKFFVPSDDVPNVSWFWADARKKFLEVIQDMAAEPAQSQDPNDRLATLVYRLVRTYLTVKAQEKSGIDLDRFKTGDKIDWDRVPQRYKDDRRQIAESLFLEYRSRHDRAFVDYFVARLGAVKQFINEDDYLVVMRALMSVTDDVKTLTLFALSANS